MSEENTQSEVLAEVEASAGRRFMALIMLMGLGALLIYLGFTSPPATLMLQLFLILLGGAVLALGVGLQRATRHKLILTEEGLYDSDAGLVVALADVAAVERGTFAFKPSHGFMVRLNTSQKGAWRPGLWWRFGRRLGIGGVTPGPQARIMADIMQALLASDPDA